MSNFINSLQKLTQCPICKGWIYEMHLNGFRTRVEPTPLNFEEEIRARLTGRKVYQSIRVGYDFEIQKRTLWHINNSDSTEFVLVGHDCSTPTIFEPAPIYEKPTFKEARF
jgi:hypothetical protein